jgi:hypothetical protein
VPATAERLPAKYLVKEEAPRTISSPEQDQAYISRLLELQRKAHRSTEETETAKLLVVVIADYEAKHFLIEKASGVEPEVPVARYLCALVRACLPCAQNLCVTQTGRLGTFQDAATHLGKFRFQRVRTSSRPCRGTDFST